MQNELKNRVDSFIEHFHDENDCNGNVITDGDLLDEAYEILCDIQKLFAENATK